jgi:hypothetical protein
MTTKFDEKKKPVFLKMSTVVDQYQLYNYIRLLIYCIDINIVLNIADVLLKDTVWNYLKHFYRYSKYRLISTLYFR